MENENIANVMNGVRQSAESFTKNQRRLHEIVSSPNTHNIQAAIDSKREIDRQDRLESLELLNKNLTRQIARLKKEATIKAIICGAAGTIIGGIFMHYYPRIINWVASWIGLSLSL